MNLFTFRIDKIEKQSRLNLFYINTQRIPPFLMYEMSELETNNKIYDTNELTNIYVFAFVMHSLLFNIENKQNK